MNAFRPKNLDEFYGQEHLIGPQGPIRVLIEKNQIRSAIFYGPSGTGKTTLANIICATLEIKSGFFNAAINNKQDLVNIINIAKTYERFLIIIDEIHRLNKDKQDILLPYLESSNIVIIGLTTNNPYHSINPAIRSRLHIFKFNQLNENDIKKRLVQISESELVEFAFDSKLFDLIASSSNGDMRYAINQLEMLTILSSDNNVSLDTYKLLNPQKSLLLDKNSDYYYDLLSGFQKSLRGSDVNASLHFLAQLINLGDLDIICRRLMVISYEDIGLANPTIHQKTLTAINAAQMLGLPEASHPLSNIVIELSLSPKSNTAYTSLSNAFNDTMKNYNIEVPDNIKHHTTTYIYPHDFGGWVDQQYLPDELINKEYVEFKNNKHEQQLKQFYDKIILLKKSKK